MKSFLLMAAFYFTTESESIRKLKSLNVPDDIKSYRVGNYCEMVLVLSSLWLLMLKKNKGNVHLNKGKETILTPLTVLVLFDHAQYIERCLLTQ